MPFIPPTKYISLLNVISDQSSQFNMPQSLKVSFFIPYCLTIKKRVYYVFYLHVLDLYFFTILFCYISSMVIEKKIPHYFKPLIKLHKI